MSGGGRMQPVRAAGKTNLSEHYFEVNHSFTESSVPLSYMDRYRNSWLYLTECTQAVVVNNRTSDLSHLNLVFLTDLFLDQHCSQCILYN